MNPIGFCSTVRGAVTAISYYGSVRAVLTKAIRIVRNEGWRGLQRRAQALSIGTRTSARHTSKSKGPDILYRIPPDDPSFRPKVSVIVPCYNHSEYLRARLDSVYGQSYGPFEVILLDDASTDSSPDILREYAARYPDITRLLLNPQNSGGVFRQWRRGLEMAAGDLIWIAESDDFCQVDFLANLVNFFQIDAVTLAFARTTFIEDGCAVWSTEEFLVDCLGDLVRKPFVRSAHWLVNQAWGIKNIVPNVSSAVFRHPGRMRLLDEDRWQTLKVCGDWIFYLHLIRGGLVAYTPRTTNFYRQHAASTARNTRGEDAYFRELQMVSTEILRLYRVGTKTMEAKWNVAHREWCLRRGTSSDSDFAELYQLPTAQEAAQGRSPNVLMVGFAFVAGGGETFPIFLANGLKSRGESVSYLNLCYSPTEPAVRNMLNATVPLIQMDSLASIPDLCEDMGIDIVHSHHAWCDTVLAEILNEHNEIKQLITMHGMYEALEPAALANHLPRLERRIHRVVYTAEKNRRPFSSDFQERKGFTRIDNALAVAPVSPVSRAALGIKDEDFVFCLVSRALPEKGWEEAILAIRGAQEGLGRRIHLVLIGTGEEYERLKPLHESATIHFLGFRSNVRDYFAMSDMGILPSRFAGESAPLVLIDCLRAGKPALASRMGEIPWMLQGRDGIAGVVFELSGSKIDVDSLRDLVARIAVDRNGYRSMLAEVPNAVDKFDPDLMISKYEDVYRALLGSGVREDVACQEHV